MMVMMMRNQVMALQIPENSLKMFHINVCSLNKKFEDVESLKSTNVNYYIIAISETAIIRNLEITKNIDIKNYNVAYIST